MPTDHAEIALDGVAVPESSMLGAEGQGLSVAQQFVHENRIRQAASSLGPDGIASTCPWPAPTSA